MHVCMYVCIKQRWNLKIQEKRGDSETRSQRTQEETNPNLMFPLPETLSLTSGWAPQETDSEIFTSQSYWSDLGNNTCWVREQRKQTWQREVEGWCGWNNRELWSWAGPFSLNWGRRLLRRKVAEADRCVERKFFSEGLSSLYETKNGWERGFGVLRRVSKVWNGLGNSPDGIARSSWEGNRGHIPQICGDTMFQSGWFSSVGLSIPEVEAEGSCGLY